MIHVYKTDTRKQILSEVHIYDTRLQDRYTKTDIDLNWATSNIELTEMLTALDFFLFS